MTVDSCRKPTVVVLLAIGVLHAVLSVCGITWGLPGRGIDRELFGRGEVWSGEKIYELSGAANKFDKSRGSDVDANPLDSPRDQPVLLTGSDEDIASIYLRYRLYTYQPDEMITMMALAGMSPGAWDFDPRLYQYGGLFIYPVGAMIKCADLLGLIDVRSDVAFYLDHPEEFGKFYIVARAYAGIWGMLGVFVVFGIARRIARDVAPSSSGSVAAGIVAALLFVLMPVVICMSHEGKPHLPGAVLMLTAVLFAMRYLDTARRGDWRMMCVCCGAAQGMVLSSWPIFVLIPLVACLSRDAGGDADRPLRRRAVQTGVGLLVSTAIYLVTNPYVVINALFHPEVIQSNLGNSFGMYRVDRIGQGLLRVLELTLDGVTGPVLLIGAIGAVGAWRRRLTSVLPLVVTAGVFFLQFVMIGADKPGEYGRFGIFPNAALVIGAACWLVPWVPWAPRRRAVRWTLVSGVTVWMGLCGYAYLVNFRADASDGGSRRHVRRLAPGSQLALVVEPAPYSCPPMPFDTTPVYLFPGREEALAAWRDDPSRWTVLWTTDRVQSRTSGPITSAGTGPSGALPTWLNPITRVTAISWANKPIQRHEASASPGP